MVLRRAYYSGDAHYAPGSDTSLAECDGTENSQQLVVGTGGVQCTSFSGKLIFNPPLTSGGGSSEQVTLRGSLSDCETPSGVAAIVTGGTVTGTLTARNNSCALFSSPGSAALKINWTSSESVAPTTLKFSNVTPFLSSGGTSFLFPTGADNYAAALTGSFSDFDAGAETSATLANSNASTCGSGSLSALKLPSGSMTIGF